MHGNLRALDVDFWAASNDTCDFLSKLIVAEKCKLEKLGVGGHLTKTVTSQIFEATKSEVSGVHALDIQPFSPTTMSAT